VKTISKNFSSQVLLIVLFLFFSAVSGCLSGDDGYDIQIPLPNPHHPGPKPGHQIARHIILFIGDGMSLENEIALSRYLYGKDYKLSWHSFQYQGYVSTWDVSSYNVYARRLGAQLYDELNFMPSIGYDPSQGGIAPYPLDTNGVLSYFLIAATDSASAATALATGFKTDSGNISWLRGDPVNGQLETIAEKIRAQKGAAIGVVSTVPFNHATPAAFVSHNTYRGNYSQIGEEIINITKPEVVIGGGHPNWNTAYVSSALIDALRASPDYVLVERIAGEDGGKNLFNAVKTLPRDKKLFGLFGGSGANFEPPVPSDTPGYPSFTINTENPSLAEATEAALRVLSRDPDGFFLMVEGGDIDWANHQNNFSYMIGAMWQLEEAVQRAIEFIELPGDDIDWTNTLMIITADHATGAMRLNDSLALGKGDLPEQIGTSYPNGEVQYNSGNHTNELVTIYARGAGINLFLEYEGTWYEGTRIIDNTQIFQVMMRSAELE
jgi:alkaline phosphatase